MDHGLPPRALIIGGSLSGLFAAASLRAIGWEVEVFERSASELSGRGGGLVLQPAVLAAIAFAGLDAGRVVGVPSGERIFLNRAGQVVQRSHAPQTQTSWNLLYGILRRGLPAGVVHANQQLLRFEQHAGGVTAYFAGGRQASGDLLIGADGAGSAVWAQLLPGLAPRAPGPTSRRRRCKKPRRRWMGPASACGNGICGPTGAASMRAAPRCWATAATTRRR
ncbi:hypothetical protein GTP56_24845 [Duganella sp. FT134W]|uniref:FAD-binding domain-containing protein n=1 Tax=Duganella margarita TaxID=2692170 RepID=A0A7X4H4V4_9BURK|nr:FAD-dependent monooxygenase [Duganella margarita]MYM75402.1 hypothetical protein [Duganella margarita]